MKQFRGGGDVKQPKIAWRRPTKIEALTTGCCVFTVMMALRVLWEMLTNAEVDYAGAFNQASLFSISYAIVSLFFKSKMVVLR